MKKILAYAALIYGFFMAVFSAIALMYIDLDSFDCLLFTLNTLLASFVFYTWINLLIKYPKKLER